METYCDILRAIGGAEKPTHGMYKANLSWTVMQAYKALQRQNLIVEDGEEGKRHYHLSQKGFTILGQLLFVKDELKLDPE